MQWGWVLLPLAVAGCATGPSLQSRMASYTGVSAETLVQDLGVPDKTISLNGVRYMAYVSQRTEVDAPPPLMAPIGPFWGWGPGPVGYYGGFPPSVTVWRCEVTFMLHEDKVVSFRMQGNDCG